MTCSNPQCHRDTPGWHRHPRLAQGGRGHPECSTDTPGWHRGCGLTHTGPAVLAGHVGVAALTLEATLGVLAARGRVAGGVHFVLTLVDVCTHDGRSVPSPLAPPQEANPSPVLSLVRSRGKSSRPAPSMAATRPVAPQWARGRPLGQGLEAQTMQAAGPRSDAETRPSWETVAPSSQPTPSRSVQPHGPHWVHR